MKLLRRHRHQRLAITAMFCVAGLLASLVSGSTAAPPAAAEQPTAEAAASSLCPTPADPTSANEFTGFRWKPAIVRRDTLGTMLPFNGVTFGYPDADSAAADGEALSVASRCGNITTLDITPQRKLIKAGTGCDDDDPLTMCPQEDEVCGPTPDPVACWKERQRSALVDYVRAARDVGMKVLLHSRVNYDDPETGATDPPSLDTYADEFVLYVTDVLDRIDAAGLAGSVKGVMIGEHDKVDGQQQGLELAQIIAQRINEGTRDDHGRGFLQRPGKMLTLHGLGFGMKFEGITDAVRATDFFARISNQASRFAFAFKLFESKYAVQYLGDPDGITIETEGRMSVADWREYLTTFRSGARDPALSELETMLRAHRSTYPRLARALFVGDASDTLEHLSHKIDPDAPTAAARVFAKYGWTGFVFGLPFDAQDVTADSTWCRGHWLVGPDGALLTQEPHQAWLTWQNTVRDRDDPLPPAQEWCAAG